MARVMLFCFWSNYFKKYSPFWLLWLKNAVENLHIINFFRLFVYSGIASCQKGEYNNYIWRGHSRELNNLIFIILKGDE